MNLEFKLREGKEPSIVLQLEKVENSIARQEFIHRFLKNKKIPKNKLNKFWREYQKYHLFDKIVDTFFKYGYDSINWEDGHRYGWFCLRDYQTFPELAKYRKIEEYKFKKDNLMYKISNLRDEIEDGKRLASQISSPSKIRKIVNIIEGQEKEIKKLERKLDRIYAKNKKPLD